ncbi:MAG: phosphopentomutase, partial [Bosea sp. (in: a-proteobacteria)]
MPRAILIVLDSVGCGGAADAAAYGDAGSDTLGHIALACSEGRADQPGLRKGPLKLPNLVKLGLAHACEASTGKALAGVKKPAKPTGQWGYGVEISQGKDTPSGHWEMAGCPVPFQWGYFRDLTDSFPPELVAAIIAQGALPGILADAHASGTQVIEDFGAEHIRTGKPICYTSVDSVLQIAAHEESFGLERLYALCKTVRKLVDPLNIGRVIARPFIGTAEAGFTRTANRKDYAIPPPDETVLDRLATRSRQIVTVGKIGDIFAHRNTGLELKAAGNMAMFDKALGAMTGLSDGGFCFVNLVDFDTEFG